LQGHSTSALKEKNREEFVNAVLAADLVIKQHGAKTALYMTHDYGEVHNRYDKPI